MKYLFILFISNFAFGASSFSELELRWASVYGINLNPNIKQLESIQKPAGATISLLSLKLFTTDFLATKDCLIYKIPQKRGVGELSVININHNESCEQKYFEKPFFKKKGIYNLSISLDSKILKIFIDKQKWNFTFFNLLRNAKKESADYSYLVPGTRISFVKAENQVKPLEEFDVCREVPNDCSQKVVDLCHLCPDGESYGVVASNCTQSLRRYCGRKPCGAKNYPACSRGRNAVKYQGSFCIADSPVGICTKPSRVVCLNEELYCR